MDAESAEALATALESDFRAAILTDADRAIINYSAMLTREPSSIKAQAIQSLRDNGLGDRAIHDLCAIVAYFAFANRIANGLGIEVESE